MELSAMGRVGSDIIQKHIDERRRIAQEAQDEIDRLAATDKEYYRRRVPRHALNQLLRGVDPHHSAEIILNSSDTEANVRFPLKPTVIEGIETEVWLHVQVDNVFNKLAEDEWRTNPEHASLISLSLVLSVGSATTTYDLAKIGRPRADTLERTAFSESEKLGMLTFDCHDLLDAGTREVVLAALQEACEIALVHDVDFSLLDGDTSTENLQST